MTVTVIENAGAKASAPAAPSTPVSVASASAAKTSTTPSIKVNHRKIHRYGYLVDYRSPFDYVHQDHGTFSLGRPLPSAFDLTPMFTPCYDQGQLGSCTANASAAVLQYRRRQQKLPEFMPSRLMIYFNGRAIEGTTKSDSGCQLRDVMVMLGQKGACPEDEWPYDVAQFAEKPPSACYAAGVRDKVLRYARVVQGRASILTAIAEAHPIIIGISVYESFESEAVATSGIVPLPSSSEALLGGHAMVVTGYETDSDGGVMLTVRNSWGTSWGLNGYCKMPLEYVLDSSLCTDLWNIDLVN